MRNVPNLCFVHFTRVENEDKIERRKDERVVSLEKKDRKIGKEGEKMRDREDERASDVWTPTRAVLITLGRPVLRLCRLEEPEEQPPYRQGPVPFMGRVKK